MSGLRWAKFWWQDWASDPTLRLCSLAAQGLWMRLLCIAAQGEPYGYVRVRGKVPTDKELAQLVGLTTDECAKPTRTLQRMVKELERNGVLSRADDGCIVSRRMEREGRLAAVRSASANARWSGPSADRERTVSGPGADFGADQQKRSKPAGTLDRSDNLHMQNPDFASTEAEAEAEARLKGVVTPLRPPTRIPSKPPRSRGGFSDSNSTQKKLPLVGIIGGTDGPRPVDTLVDTPLRKRRSETGD